MRPSSGSVGSVCAPATGGLQPACHNPPSTLQDPTTIMCHPSAQGLVPWARACARAQENPGPCNPPPKPPPPLAHYSPQVQTPYVLPNRPWQQSNCYNPFPPSLDPAVRARVRACAGPGGFAARAAQPAAARPGAAGGAGGALCGPPGGRGLPGAGAHGGRRGGRAQGRLHGWRLAVDGRARGCCCWR